MMRNKHWKKEICFVFLTILLSIGWHSCLGASGSALALTFGFGNPIIHNQLVSDSVHIAALLADTFKLLFQFLLQEASWDQMIVLRGPGDQVSSEGYKFVGVAVQERVPVASPFHPDLK